MDHKPLTAILGLEHVIPPIAAARLLSSYSYSIEFKSTVALANADCLLRLLLSNTIE